MTQTLIHIFKKARRYYRSRQRAHRIKKYLSGGRIPWSTGYEDYKWNRIKKVLESKEQIQCYCKNELPSGLTFGLDERIIEYPWIISNLNDGTGRLLDAGSTFNFEMILNHKKISGKELTIFTLFPESANFHSKKISYVYGDLRAMPFIDEWFDEIVCQSTLEHVGMNNTMYGESADDWMNSKDESYLKALQELERCLKINGVLLMTVPFGQYEYHGFFQQFDKRMIKQIVATLEVKGDVTLHYFKYLEQGWIYSNEADCEHAVSFNPHTGKGLGTDHAAHSRSICCIKFSKAH
jgi:SAM-dependent methyltransferase